MGEIVKKVEGLPMSPFNIKKEIIQKILISESPDILYSNIINLYEEVQSHNEVTMDKNIILAYISKFEDGGTEKDKNAFFEKISEDVKTVAQNKPVDFFGNKDYYTYILKEVYLTRNYNTYENIDKYEDRTKDLDKYVFDRNGYELKLSGVLGYKIREGVETNQVLIDEFLTRIKSIKSIATTKTLSEFLEKNIQDGSAKTIEGKILEYFKQNGYTVDTMNVLLAYQLFF
jgi:hypothetical protein